MIADVLEPRMELMREEYVLVQAWKKTASYIRYHNWYSDTLELDRVAINLPSFLARLARMLESPDQWNSDPLRIVPAPKNQKWHVNPETRLWGPVKRGTAKVKLRPLAHVSLKDQVAATAVMLCLANRVETLQGDPRESIGSAEARRRVISYGNRLFCDNIGGELYHRWGSEKLYRAYFQDYRSFLSRSEIVADAIATDGKSQVVMVHADLRQFYDRVRPGLLAQKIDAIEPIGDPLFYSFIRRLLNWEWDRGDSGEVAKYAELVGLSDFSAVALPQGLVAAGFFANVALLDFDQGLRETFSREIVPGLRLEDACRYVDDLHLILTVDHGKKLAEIEQLITHWLREFLNRYAEGLKPAEEKTRAAFFEGDERPLVRQSRRMRRIQGAISGGFDAIGGAEILDAIQGLVRSQERYSEQRMQDQGWAFSPIPDVRDETVARFAAGRFRSTYRSLRPLLPDRSDLSPVGEEDESEYFGEHPRVARSRAELDDEARAFALGLIESWIEDPSNVRLLRIGLDLWPAADLLKSVLALLRPFTEGGSRPTATRRVAWYCLSEIFRAGATETGIVEDHESLPGGISIVAYRSVLQDEAIRLASSSHSTLPWYLRQQVLLFLAAVDTPQPPIIRSIPEIKQYRELIRFLNGESEDMTGADFATLAILSRRSFRGHETAAQLTGAGINPYRLGQIAERDPSFAIEILESMPDLSTGISPRLRGDLCLDRHVKSQGWVSLAEVVLGGGPKGPLRNELALLRFALRFLKAWPTAPGAEIVTPCDVLLTLPTAGNTLSEFDALKILPNRVAPAGSIYSPPSWCPTDERWRFHLGYLLRFILVARQDFTKVVRPLHWKERTATYREPDSHWYQRLYGLYNGQSAFGDDWLPISDWTERLLSALLHWPGCVPSEMAEWVRHGIGDTCDNIEKHLAKLSEMQGPSTKLLLLPLTAPRLVKSSESRPLRACVVQTVIPTTDDIRPADLTLSDPAIRIRHRNHLSAALAAIERMLDLRETHKGRDGRLDWLILPELSVHPRDVRTHLVPFARKHRAIVLAGLTYEALFACQPLINSAIWVIPEWSADHGLQVRIRRQGKYHLAPAEQELNAAGAVVQGFRPCQWLVGYDWSGRPDVQPLWLTASICYDATDLALAADLRHHSDVFAIPALNKDVNTFDQMALALHYHMFQYVIVANNGQYGGSNAYIPHREVHVRQVFHLHGQPQASVAFLEIDDIAGFLERKSKQRNQAPPVVDPNAWKSPPAGI